MQEQYRWGSGAPIAQQSADQIALQVHRGLAGHKDEAAGLDGLGNPERRIRVGRGRDLANGVLRHVFLRIKES